MVKTMKISEEVHERLSKIGGKTDTYNDIVKYLLDIYDNRNRKRKK